MSAVDTHAELLNALAWWRKAWRTWSDGTWPDAITFSHALASAYDAYLADEQPREWHLPEIPADVTRVTANGALYERDPDRPSRWYQLNSVHARVVGGSCELGQLFQVAGPDGIREAVPE